MKERSPPESASHKSAKLLRQMARIAGEGGMSMPFYPSVKEDKERKQGEPGVADKFGGDVVVVRVGSRPHSKAKIRLASKAIRSAKKSS